MSPGAELQLKRRASILAELEAPAAKTTPQPDRIQTPPSPAALMAAEPDPQGEAGEMQMAMAEPHDEKPAASSAAAMASQSQGPQPGAPLISQIHYQQVQNLLLEADAISGALAADDLAQFKAHVARLPTVLAPVQKDLAGLMHWEELLEPLAALSKGDPPRTSRKPASVSCPSARRWSSWPSASRRTCPAFAGQDLSLPMAPKPGLWMQAKGPLRNPFYGAKMLKCGEEVP